MTLLTNFSRTAVASLAILTLSAQAQFKAPAIDEAGSANDSAAISASPSGIFQASSIAKPADTLGNLARDAGKTGADPQTLIKGVEQAKRPRAPARPEAPNQFQRFVQEATGKLLPHFGSPLFEAPDNYDPDSSLPVPANYVLGPGDEIRLQVWGAVDFNATLVIDRNGQVLVPKVGVVPLSGVAMRDLETVLRGSLSKVFTNFSLNANLGRLRSIQIYVMGQAKQPGTFVVSSLSTLVNALLMSGGPNSSGTMRHIKLQRQGKTLTEFDLYDLIAKGDKSKDLPLLPGDVIVIPPAGPRVALTGAYDQTAIYELKDANTTVADILALGGGALSTTNSQKVLLERITPHQNPARQVQDLALDAAGLKQTLQDADVLTLLPISPAFTNAVTLRGNVAFPLRYAFRPGMKVADLIPEPSALIQPDYYARKNIMVQFEEAKQVKTEQVFNDVKNLLDEINWDYAAIERIDANAVRTTLIPFNLAKAIKDKDPANNLALQPGDVVTIFGQRDLRVPLERQLRLVRVEGEVAAPGVYQALAGETLPQLIKRVGGLTPQAYLFGTELRRESVRTRQQDNLDTLVRKFEAQANSQAGAQVANVGSTNPAQAVVLLQQQQAQTKLQLERLRSLKSNGRMALELDPKAQVLAALPAVTLEDGDRVLVPSVPSFVSAVGSVNNDNVFIYRPGKTIADVLRSAGLAEDAEPDQAFVLRADGSVVARRDYSGLFGGSFESLQVMPGDTVVVPAQIDRESRYTAIVRGFKDWTQILSNLGLGIAALGTISKL